MTEFKKGQVVMVWDDDEPEGIKRPRIFSKFESGKYCTKDAYSCTLRWDNCRALTPEEIGEERKRCLNDQVDMKTHIVCGGVPVISVGEFLLMTGELKL